MTQSLLVSIATTGFGVAFFHAAIPTHWLPFVLAARGQRWSRGKTLTITALAGGGHVLFTAVLGVLVVGLGVTLQRWTGEVFPMIAGGALLLFGFYYLSRGGKHGHHHWGPGHHHEHPQGEADIKPVKWASDRAAIVGLLTLLTFSPCEGFLPIYLSGIAYGWTGFLLLSGVLMAATIAGMLAFTWLALIGLEKLELGFVERYESAILGGLLILLGILVIVFKP